MEKRVVSDPEGKYRSANRVWKVVAIAAALLLACGMGMVAGGGIVYAVMRLRDLRPPVGAQPVPTRAGVVIVAVLPDSPAARAGLQSGDIILAVDGQELDAERDLAAVIARYKPGDKVTLKTERPGQGSRDVTVELGTNPEDEAAPYLGVQYSAWPGRQGLPSPGSPSDRFRFDELPFVLPGGGSLQGVLVLQVSEDSPAAAAGLEVGELITAVDGKSIGTPEDLSQAVAARSPGDQVTLTLVKPGTGDEREVQVKLGERPDDRGKAYLGLFAVALPMSDPGNDQLPREFHFRGSPFDFSVPSEELPFDWEELQRQFKFWQAPQEDGGGEEPSYLEDSL